MMTREEMLKRISCCDFYIIDLHLYLNTHPNDTDAIMLYNEAVKQGKALREVYEASYGMLLANCSQSKSPWQWIENPWPWQKKFNFELGDMG